MAQWPTDVRRGLTILVTVAVAFSATSLAGGVWRAAADVTAVTGSAYGYRSDVSLFGGPSSERGPEPTVELAGDVSNSPQQASVDAAQAVYGPAVVFRSGPIEVRTEGELGAGGASTSSAKITGHPDPEQRPGPLLYDGLESSCSADEDGVTATATVTGGVVETKYDPETQLPVETVPVPDNPEPGHTVEGTIDHVGDRFRIVFNEQTENDDGSVTVIAAHMYLLGDIAVGDLIIGQSVCGVTAAAGTTTTTTSTTTTTLPAPTPTNTPDPLSSEEEDGGLPVAAVGAGGLLALAAVGGLVLALRRRTTGGP